MNTVIDSPKLSARLSVMNLWRVPPLLSFVFVVPSACLSYQTMQGVIISFSTLLAVVFHVCLNYFFYWFRYFTAHSGFIVVHNRIH